MELVGKMNTAIAALIKEKRVARRIEGNADDLADQNSMVARIAVLGCAATVVILFSS
jgi:hypothetical protein